jgi:hypothetical protein
MLSNPRFVDEIALCIVNEHGTIIREKHRPRWLDPPAPPVQNLDVVQTRRQDHVRRIRLTG